MEESKFATTIMCSNDDEYLIELYDRYRKNGYTYTSKGGRYVVRTHEGLLVVAPTSLSREQWTSNRHIGTLELAIAMAEKWDDQEENRPKLP